MRLPQFALSSCLAGLLCTAHALASERSFVDTQESRVLAPGDSELEPWTTFRVGHKRYFSALDGRLELEHGLVPGLQLALYWNFSAQSQDVVTDELSGKIERVSESAFDSASFELKYQLSDATADALGSALYLETTLGPSESEVELKLIADHSFGKLLLAANLTGELEIEPIRNDEGTEIETALVIEPALGISYMLPHNLHLGLELIAPFGVTGEEKSSVLMGGPVLGWADRGYWLTLGVLPQLVAFSGQSPNSRLDLEGHERLEVRLIAGFML